MPFHHPAFFVLFLVTLVAYWTAPARWQHVILLISSLAFYYYAGLVDSIILLASVGANHPIALTMAKREGNSRRRWVTFAVVLNLGILAYWKYRGFFVENTLRFFPSVHFDRAAMERDLPLGISFYLFQLIAYQVDLYRKEIEPEPKFWRVLLYVLFFPHHQAGPIMRPAKFLPQFYGEKRWSTDAMQAGGWLLLIGLAKKCGADAMAPVVDDFFGRAARGAIPAWQAWRGALAFGFQIYGDFSGYSDIAVGIALMLGYQLDVNFRQPYVSADPSEFWRRWHITLSQWLRDYLYISLGGNRRGERRTYINLFLTMVLGGFWHGASWMFILWGAIHGAFLIVHRGWPKLFGNRAIGVIVTFVVVTAAWVPFRATSMTQCGRILGAMFFVHRAPGDTLVAWGVQLAWTSLVVAIYAIEYLGRTRADRLSTWWWKTPAPARGLMLATAIAAVVLTLSSSSTYVYFRF